MRITVTGATGHVGANLVRALLARGDQVRALIHRIHRDNRSLAGLDVERVAGDVLDPASLDRAFAGAEVVFHLAALISIQGDRGGLVPSVNVGGAKNAAEAALRAGVRRFVHTSSVHAFDLTRGGVIDETSPRSDGPHLAAYDRSKAAGERAVREVLARRGLDAVVVHPTGIIGPFDFEPSRMGRTLLGLRDRSLPSLVAGGFDFVDVRDVVQALLAAAERGRTGGELPRTRQLDRGRRSRARGGRGHARAAAEARRADRPRARRRAIRRGVGVAHEAGAALHGRVALHACAHRAHLRGEGRA